MVSFAVSKTADGGSNPSERAIFLFCLTFFKQNNFVNSCFLLNFAAKNRNSMNNNKVYMGHMYIFRDKSANGVFIEDVNCKLWKTEDWDGSVRPNAIVVIADESKFRIAIGKQGTTSIGGNNCPFESRMSGAKFLTSFAKADSKGSCHTASILKLLPNTSYAAGYCNAFTFPDGKTHGYLPSLGQLTIAYRHKEEIGAALNKCGGIPMNDDLYWSSTFWGVDCANFRLFWALNWEEGSIGADGSCFDHYVRPFADF